MRQVKWLSAGTLLGAAVVTSAAQAAPRFTEVTGPAGFRFSGESYGASWGDFNGDLYPDLHVNNHRLKDSIYRNNGNGTFTDVIATVDASGVWQTLPKQDTHGSAWADFDNDGDQDLYVTTGGAFDARMLVNQGGLLYNQATELGVREDVEGRSPMWIDFDQNGKLDLAVMIRSASRLFRQGTGSFNNVTASSGLYCPGTDYGSIVDLSGDSVTDIVCAKSLWPAKTYDTTTFPLTDISAGVAPIQRAIDVAIADFDGDLTPEIFAVAGQHQPSDAALVNATRLEASLGAQKNKEKGLSFDGGGRLDLTLYIVNNLRNPNKLHVGAAGDPPAGLVQNATGFTFTLDAADPVTHGMAPHDPSVDAGFFIGYDPGLGRWQIWFSGLAGHSAGAYLVVNSSAAMSNVAMQNLLRFDLPEEPRLLVKGAAGYTQQGAVRGLTEKVSCISVAAADFDNDGDLDVYAACRTGVKNLPNLVYENLGDGTFRKVASHGAEGVTGFHLADKAGLADSVVSADYDLDGCVDLFVVNGLPLHPGRHGSGPHQLFQNRCDYGNGWLELDLEGLGAGGANRDGIGARVFVTAGGTTQLREQLGGYHRWSQNHTRLHFGLGASPGLVDVRVVWPSGSEDLFSNVNPNRVYLAREGAAELVAR